MNKLERTTFVVFLILLFSNVANAQHQLAPEYFSEVRQGQSTRLYDILKKNDRKEMTPAVMDSLVSYLNKPYPHKETLIKIIGFAGSEKNVVELQPFSAATNPPIIRWNTLLALSRLGDKNALSDIMIKTRKLPVNDDVVYQLFPDLIYTRQREAINYLVEVLMSDQPNCESPNNNNPMAIPCGYRIMEQLAPVIKNYPLTLDKSGDIKTNDYKSSLKTIRKWFMDNKNYEIDNSKF